MRVLFPAISGSGVEIYTERLLSGLAPLGWNGELLRFSPAWEYFPWGLAWALNRSIPRTQDCNLVHVNADYGCHFAVAGKPLVATLHHSSIDEFYLSSLSLPVRWHHRLVLTPSVAETMRRANALVAVSRHTRDTVCEVFQQQLPIRVIPNGIETNRFHAESGEMSIARSKSNRPVVLFFSGNPSHRKGTDLLVPVMRQLGRDFELRATGGLRGAPGSAFEAPNIRCLGRLSEDALIHEINQADISFQPSRREGFGLSILEAMSCAKPVVSSNVSAIPELVEHEKGGYLCEPGSVDQLVRAIRKLAQSETLCRQMGQFNRSVVEEKFTLARMAQAYSELYHEVVS